MVGTAHMKDVVTGISWSPKGKQLVVGDASGRMHQLKPELTSVRVVDPPAAIPQLRKRPSASAVPFRHSHNRCLAAPYHCVGLCWVSTTEWLIAHASHNGYKANVSLLTIKKGQAPQWQPYGDVTFGSDAPTAPLPLAIRFVPIFDWQMVCAGNLLRGICVRS